MKDGTLMWKHALLNQNKASLPVCEAHEQHIIKTAQRLEELNSWVSQDLEPWNFLVPCLGMCLACLATTKVSLLTSLTRLKIQLTVYDIICNHTPAHETLDLRDKYIYFKRC